MSDKLNVGFLTSWNTRCGISEYSRHLVDALRRRDDVSVQVFGSKNYDEYKIAEDEEYVKPVFGVLPWNKYGDHSFEVETILASRVDVLHVQYEVLLYNQQGFNELLEAYTGLKVVTFHDNCIPPSFPVRAFDLAYTHREDVGVGSGYVLNMGVENFRPVVKTFGLGRSRHDLIAPICDRNAWDFEYSFGEKEWKTQAEYYKWLRDSDAIVLWYDDTPAAGVSSALRDAMATRRPVICNNVTWFKDFEPKKEYNWYKVDTLSELESTLTQLLDNVDLVINSWDAIADIIVTDYELMIDREFHDSSV